MAGDVGGEPIRIVLATVPRWVAEMVPQAIAADAREIRALEAKMRAEIQACAEAASTRFKNRVEGLFALAGQALPEIPDGWQVRVELDPPAIVFSPPAALPVEN